MNKVVARYADGRVMKGFTADFVPTKDSFHLGLADAPAGAKPVTVLINELKALFFVKDFTGDPKHEERKEFDPSQRVVGRKMKVVFKDGEVLVGTTQAYQAGRPGFFLVPADPQSNAERLYVVTAATQEVSFL